MLVKRLRIGSVGHKVLCELVRQSKCIILRRKLLGRRCFMHI